jgi:hypothetical protein
MPDNCAKTVQAHVLVKATAFYATEGGLDAVV